MLKVTQYTSELADMIQEKYLHNMYSLRTSCVSHKHEIDDLKLLVDLHASGISCSTHRQPEVKSLEIPCKHNNSNLLL